MCPLERAVVARGADAALASGAAPASGATGSATRNVKPRLLAPGAPDAVAAAAEVSRAPTLTNSPSEKGWSGTKAVPALSGSSVRRPAWSPLREPWTLTEARSGGLRAEKMIDEVGEASGVPGKGMMMPLGSSSWPWPFSWKLKVGINGCAQSVWALSVRANTSARRRREIFHDVFSWGSVCLPSMPFAGFTPERE